MKVLDEAGVARLVENVGNAVRNGKWLPVRQGENNKGELVKGAVIMGDENTNTASGDGSCVQGHGCSAKGGYSHAEGDGCIALEWESHAEGEATIANGEWSHAEGRETITTSDYCHAEGEATEANAVGSHAEGYKTQVSGWYSHAEGIYNYDNENFLFLRGVGSDSERKNAEAVYVGRKNSELDPTDPKNGYKYLLGIGGYEGQEIGDAKSLQEVIAEHEASLNDIGALSNEEIDSIIGDVA